MSERIIMVVIPAYNAAGEIADVVRGLPKTIQTKAERFRVEVVIVEDGSKDATYDEARKTDATVLRHVMNSGSGAATRTGLRYAMLHDDNLAFVVTIDADGQHATEDVERMVQFAAEHPDVQMVVGNRLHGGNKEHMPLHRTIGNRGLSLIGRILFGITVEDTQTGLRLLTPVSLPIVSDFTIDRYGFCTEMLWLATREHLTIKEVPIAVTYSEETLAKGQANWGAVDLILDLLWIRISR